MAYPSAQRYAEQIFPYVQQEFPNLTPHQQREFATVFSTHGLSGFYEGTCLPLDESDTERISRLLQAAAKERPELVTAPPTPHEILALIEKSGPLPNEQRMTKFRELQSMTPDELLHAADVNALIAARAETLPAAKPATGLQTSQSAANRWHAMSQTEKIDEAAFVFGVERHRVLSSHLKRLDDAAKPNGLAQRDAKQVEALKAHDPKTLDAASRMTIARWDRDHG